MVNKEREKVVWKTYLDYPFIEANQFGEIRMKDHYVNTKRGLRLIKGRVLKQYAYPNGYMFVRFSINGKHITLLVHRIVATCFLPNPNNYPQVNHKDNNRANNVVSNLEWCSREYNEAYKKNFGTTQAQIQGKPVYAVDLETGKVLRFETRMEAARQLGVYQSDIPKVVKGELNQIGGCWFTEDENKITENKIQEVKANMNSHKSLSHPVIVVNLDTFDVSWFESQSEAARQLGASAGNVCSVLKGKLNKTKDCWLTYANEDAIEKIRAKFGDKIANKVEKLMREHL